MSDNCVEILIKPASMHCNLRCSYCFYMDETSKRTQIDKGMMSKETASLVIKRAFELGAKELCFTFQGGEPLLAGLDFFEYFVREVKNQNTSNTSILWSMQTNGTLIDESWAKFLEENNFLVGISLDGPKDINDGHRGAGTFDKVLSSIENLKKHGIVPNVLCVVNNDSDAKECYELYKSLGLDVQQYIPCLEPLGETNDFLAPNHFGDFLCNLYDLWIDDIKNGEKISIRYFENLALMLSGAEAESCNFCGGCKLQFVTESNGDVYPCDFYCMDEYKLGNVASASYINMLNTSIAKNFIQKRRASDYDDDCKSCAFFKLCKAGCKREFMGSSHTQFCQSYKKLFEHIRLYALQGFT